MKLYIRQKVFSFTDRFSIFDQDGQPKYWAEGELFSLAKRLHVSDVSGEEVITIEQELLSFVARYRVLYKRIPFALIRQRLSLTPSFEIEGPGWEVKGSFFGHDFTIYDDQTVIAHISKQWMRWGDSYEIDIVDEVNELPILAIVLGIDAAAARSKG